MIKAFKYMFCKEGIRGFFKGNGINCAINAPFNAFEFYFYQFFKNNLFGQDN